MKKQYFKNFRKEGLPGGPNEITINSEGFILSENGQWEFPGLPTVIPSSDITMQGVPYPVLGISDTGDTQMMYPEEDYQFDGDMVYELPMAQKGYNVKPRKGSILLEGETEPSTHLMRREYIPNTGWVAFPSLFQNEDGTWVDMSKEEDWMNIYDEANRRGEVYNFGENKRKAIKFADKGSWKKDLGIKKQGGGDISIPDLTKPNWLDTLPKQYAGGGDLPPMEVNIGLPKYGKKRVLNLKDYTKQNTTSNRFPVVQNPFSRENKINLHLPENHGEEHRRLEVNPYFGGVNDEPNLNVYYGGVDADLNLLNKNNNILDLRGGLNTGLVTYPGGSEFTGVNPSVGLSYSHKFAEGGSLGDDPTKPYHPTLNPDGYKGTIPPVTSNDSLVLYNNTIELEKFYGDPSRKYKIVKDNNTEDWNDKERLNDIIKGSNQNAKDNIDFYNAMIKASPMLSHDEVMEVILDNYLEKDRGKVMKGLLNNKTGYITPTRFQTKDNITGAINWAAPYNIIDTRIQPDYINHYSSVTDPGMLTDVYGYDKDKIKPWALRTDAEKKKELLRRGLSNKTSNNMGSYTNLFAENIPEPRIPYSPVQTNQLNTVQIPTQYPKPTTDFFNMNGEPPTYKSNPYWKVVDNNLVLQNNPYASKMVYPISDKPGTRFYGNNPSWQVGEDRYYEEDGTAYKIPRPEGGWPRTQILDPNKGEGWKSKMVKKKQDGGWLNELPKAQKGKMLNKERQQLLKEKEFEDFLKKSSVDEQGTLTYVLPEYTVKSPEKKLYDQAFQDALNKQKSFQNKWYPGDISEGVLDNMKQRASVIANDKVAKDILDNNKIKDLKGYQKDYIANSNYSGKLRPGIFQEFGEGVQDLGRITQGKLPTTKALGLLSPLEYPVNLVRGTVKGEGLDALKGKISSPWIDASKVDIGAVNDVGAYNTIYNIGLDPLNLTGIGLTGAADDALRGISKGSKYFKTNKIVNTPKQLPGSTNVNPLVNTTPTPWTMQEMPGLHLKSTMSDGAVSKIVEPKTGLVNVEQALGIIGKESGGADKVALIKQGLGETLPKKMDYNEFRKVVQDQLIPLEVKINPTGRSEYGLERIGYYDEPPMDRGALTLSNKGKFGRGSSAHGNPDETLGHIHFLRDAETPDVLTVTQIQSDAFQGTHRIMPKVFNKEQELRGLSMMEDKLKVRELDYSKAKKLPNGDYKFDDGLVMDKTLYEQGLTVQREMNAMKKADIESYTQKSLLDKDHQARFLQEFVNYAAQKGNINKVRVPTSETAAKVQNYVSVSNNTIGPNTKKLLDNSSSFDEFLKAKYDEVDGYDFNNEELKSLEKIFNDYKSGTLKPTYEPQHQTILKKYSEQPKLIKKLFGQDVKVVTDSKGNTWYEFDIPEGFKGMKGEIKAFSMGGVIAPPAAIIGAGALQQSNQKKNGGWLDNLPKAQKGNTGKQSANESWGLTQESQLSDLTKGLLNNILHRQAFAESSFNPKVISGDKTSRVGALGMTQIMPETLNEYINKTGDKNINILDPKDAVKVQKWYMQDLLNADFIHKPNQSEKVRMVKALGSYNWGRGNMSKFLGKQKKKGVDIYSDELSWVNDLPVETRDYVNKIVLGTNEKFNQEYKQNSSKYKDYYQKGGWLDKL